MPAAGCPVDTNDRGVLAGRRVCALPQTILGTLELNEAEGIAYAIEGKVRVGTDCGIVGGEPSTCRGQLVIRAPGAVLFGESETDRLVVERFSDLSAVGAPDAPVVFTSRANLEGTADSEDTGGFGGVFVLGRGPVSDPRCNTPDTASRCEVELPGLGSFYGGDDPGGFGIRLEYVQIRYAERGLVLAGSGTNTMLDRVQVANSGTGVTWLGGRGRGRRLVVTRPGSVALTFAKGFRGVLQQVIAGPDAPVALEVGSDREALNNGRTSPFIANATLIGGSTNAAAVRFFAGVDAALVNSVVVGASTCLDVDGQETMQAAGNDDDNGPPLLRSIHGTCPGGVAPEDGDVTAAAIEGLLGARSRLGPSSLADLFVNGPNESAVVPTPFADLSLAQIVLDFLEAKDHVGAVRDAQDRWFDGWTCGTGSGASPCSQAP